MTTKEVLDHHLKCFAEGDLEGILSDYGPDAVLFTQMGPLKGTKEMAPVFQTLFEEFKKPGASFELKQESVDGEVAFVVWNAETADNVYELGTDTLVVRDGKIVAQSFAGEIKPKA